MQESESTCKERRVFGPKTSHKGPEALPSGTLKEFRLHNYNQRLPDTLCTWLPFSPGNDEKLHLKPCVADTILTLALFGHHHDETAGVIWWSCALATTYDTISFTSPIMLAKRELHPISNVYTPNIRGLRYDSACSIYALHYISLYQNEFHISNKILRAWQLARGKRHGCPCDQLRKSQHLGSSGL